MVRDPRTSEADSKRFLDMMERYFSQDLAAKLADVRPELHYQVCGACLMQKCHLSPAYLLGALSQLSC